MNICKLLKWKSIRLTRNLMKIILPQSLHFQSVVKASQKEKKIKSMNNNFPLSFFVTIFPLHSACSKCWTLTLRLLCYADSQNTMCSLVGAAVLVCNSYTGRRVSSCHYAMNFKCEILSPGAALIHTHIMQTFTVW